MNGTAEIRAVSTTTGFELRQTDNSAATLYTGSISSASNSIRMLVDVSGTPLLSASLEIVRGSSANAQLLWDESSDTWKLGVVGNLPSVCRRVQVQITNSNLVSGVYTFTHNLGVYPHLTILDNTLNNVFMSRTDSSVNELTINFTNIGTLTGTWTLVAIG